MLAALVCRFFEIPCAGYEDDYGVVFPERPVFAASDAFTSFRDCLGIILKKRGSDAGAEIELSLATVDSRQPSFL